MTAIAIQGQEQTSSHRISNTFQRVRSFNKIHIRRAIQRRRNSCRWTIHLPKYRLNSSRSNLQQMIMSNSKKAWRAQNTSPARRNLGWRNNRSLGERQARRRKWAARTRPSCSRCSRASFKVFRSWNKIKSRWAKQARAVIQMATSLQSFRTRSQPSSWPSPTAPSNKGSSSSRLCLQQPIRI